MQGLAILTRHELFLWLVYSTALMPGVVLGVFVASATFKTPITPIIWVVSIFTVVVLYLAVVVARLVYLAFKKKKEKSSEPN